MEYVVPFVLIALAQLTFGAVWKERGLLITTIIALIVLVILAVWLWAPEAIQGIDLVYSPFALLIAGALVTHVLVSAALVAYRRSEWHTYDQA